MRITNGGKVGIGTATPAEKLTVSGNISASGTIKAKTLDADAITDGLAAIIVAEIDNDEIPIAKLAEDAVYASMLYNLSKLRPSAAGGVALYKKEAYAKMQNVAANSVLVRDANSSGVVSAKALATTEIMIGDGTGMIAAALSGDITMTNAGVTSIADALFYEMFVKFNSAIRVLQ